MQTKNSKLFYFLLVLCPLLLTVILFQNCSREKGSAMPPNSEQVSMARAGGLSNYCGDTACFGYDGSFLTGKIDFATARKMADSYAGDKGKYFVCNGSQVTSEQDARNIWFN